MSSPLSRGAPRYAKIREVCERPYDSLVHVLRTAPRQQPKQRSEEIGQRGIVGDVVRQIRRTPSRRQSGCR